MMHYTWSRLPTLDGHPQGVHDDLRSEVILHRPTDHPTRVDIEDEGQIEEAFPRGDLGDIRHPDPVHLRGREAPLDRIFDRKIAPAPTGAPSSPAALPRVQPRSPAWRMSLSTRLREQRVPSVLEPTWTLGDPYVRPLRSWISRIVSVRTPSSRFLAEDGLPDYIVS